MTQDSPPKLPSAFVWQDPALIPPRPWLYGHHLLRGQLSVTVAPGGVGKSSLTICEALAMASGRPILGEWTAPDLKVWVFNLEDPQDELTRRIVAAMTHHQIAPESLSGRLFVDSGRDRELCVAVQTRTGAQLLRPALSQLTEEIRRRGIDVLVIDPFVSCHRVDENDNGAIDMVAKAFAKVAGDANCAIELVHHTRKTNGAEASSQDARGASALLGAARSGRVLNRMPDDMKDKAGLRDDPGTYFAVDRDKANLAPAGKRTWRRMVSVQLENGDNVGVAEAWEFPDAFDGVSVADTLKVQQALEGQNLRYSDQAADWAGHRIAQVLGLTPGTDARRIRSMIETWLRSGVLVKGSTLGPNRKPVPTLDVGEWVTA